MPTTPTTPTPVGKRRRTNKSRLEPGSDQVDDKWKIHHEIAFLGPDGTYGQQVGACPPGFLG